MSRRSAPFAPTMHVPAAVADAHSGATTELVALDADHPGFHDAIYRHRRNEIARVALEYHEGDRVPHISYTDDEQRVWREVWRNLAPLHEKYACREYLHVTRRVDQ